MKKNIIIIILIITLVIISGLVILNISKTSNNDDYNTNNTNTNKNYNKVVNISTNNSNVKDKTNTNNIVDTKKALLDVMNNNKTFINEDNIDVFLKDFKIVENQTVNVDKYAFVNLDNDNIEELVIHTTSDYGAYIILHYESNKIYGYMIGERSFENLKTDGSFMASNGANSIEYLRIKFDKNSFNLNTEAIYDNINKDYQIKNNLVSEAEINEYIEKWNQKENIDWLQK